MEDILDMIIQTYWYSDFFMLVSVNFSGVFVPAQNVSSFYPISTALPPVFQQTAFILALVRERGTISKNSS
jgi:hypothetical protein